MGLVSASFDGDFEAPTANAEKCEISLGLPKIPFPPTIRINLPPFPPPFLPKLIFEFSLNCDPHKPINLTADIQPNAGRVNTSDERADDRDD